MNKKESPHILVIAQHDNQCLHASYPSILAAALQLGGAVTVLVAGYACQLVVDAVKNQAKVSHILVADMATYQYFLAESLASLIADLCESKGYTHVLMPATRWGNDVLPRAAALLDVALVSEVIQVIDANQFVRPLRAGTVLATVYNADRVKLMTVRASAFPAQNGNALLKNQEIYIESITPVSIESRTWLIEESLQSSKRPELTTARIVLAGGRALKAEGFELLGRIADHLRAAVGASRGAVDAGLIAHDCQIGQTGKAVAPDLYIAVGISGALHHVAGMRASKIVVGINRDVHAPIFEEADYCLVMDLFVALPLLEQELAFNLNT